MRIGDYVSWKNGIRLSDDDSRVVLSTEVHYGEIARIVLQGMVYYVIDHATRRYWIVGRNDITKSSDDTNDAYWNSLLTWVDDQLEDAS